jgi:hypothetical protein
MYLSTNQYSSHTQFTDGFNVQLRAIILAPTMQRNNLMANDVVAWRQLGGQNGGYLEVVSDERVGDPSSWGYDGGLGDLGPAEGGGGEGCAVAFGDCALVNIFVA